MNFALKPLKSMSETWLSPRTTYVGGLSWVDEYIEVESVTDAGTQESKTVADKDCHTAHSADSRASPFISKKPGPFSDPAAAARRRGPAPCATAGNLPPPPPTPRPGPIPFNPDRPRAPPSCGTRLDAGRGHGYCSESAAGGPEPAPLGRERARAPRRMPVILSSFPLGKARRTSARNPPLRRVT